MLPAVLAIIGFGHDIVIRRQFLLAVLQQAEFLPMCVTHPCAAEDADVTAQHTISDSGSYSQISGSSPCAGRRNRAVIEHNIMVMNLAMGIN